MRRSLLLMLTVFVFSGSGFAQDAPATGGMDAVFESVPLLSGGTFEPASPEAADRPGGWHSDAPKEAWQLDRKTFLQGSGSLRLSGGAPVAVISDSVPLGEEFSGLNAVAMGRGTGGAAKVRWLGRDGGVVREDALRALKASDGQGWTRFTLGETARPEGAVRVSCVLEASAPAGESFWWDAVEITANYERKPSAAVLVNQAGYESFAPKRFVVSSNVEHSGGAFKVVTREGRTVLDGTLENPERVTGLSGADWGRYFYRGDFTPIDQEGEYLIQVKLGALEASSPAFTVRFDQLWLAAFDRAVRAVAACRNEAGGALWNDPGQPAMADAEVFWTLVASWSAVKWKLELTGVGTSLAEEVRRAAPLAAGRVAGAPGEQLPAWAAGLARYASLERGDAAAADAARAAVAALGDGAAKKPLAFSAVWDLYVRDGDAALREKALGWFPGANIDAIEPLLDYESETGGMVTPDMAVVTEKLAVTLLKRAKNPFGVYATEDKGGLCYFLPSQTEPAGTPAGMGNTHRVLMAAELMAKAYRFQSKPEYLAFMYDQLNWVFGCNPQGVCLMAGVGLTHPAPVTGANPPTAGMLVNGIGPKGPGDDRPWIAVGEGEQASEATNGFALRNNVRFISAMAQLKRIRTAQPQDEAR